MTQSAPARCEHCGTALRELNRSDQLDGALTCLNCYLDATENVADDVEEEQ
jgi:protein-arginine kinase activator protein McsA